MDVQARDRGPYGLGQTFDHRQVPPGFCSTPHSVDAHDSTGLAPTRQVEPSVIETGGDEATVTETIPAQMRVHHGAENPSHVILPVLSKD